MTSKTPLGAASIESILEKAHIQYAKLTTALQEAEERFSAGDAFAEARTMLV